MIVAGAKAMSKEACGEARKKFSAYLDGEMSGVEMAALAGHLESCGACHTEFAGWREVQQSLAQMGPAKAPMQLQARLRTALSEERQRGAHLSWNRRALMVWKSSLAPVALRAAGGFAVALVMLGGLGWLFAAPLAVQANDDNLAHMVSPRYLYSQVPPQPITTHRDVPIVIEAKVDTNGRVYDYAILAGPSDQPLQVRVEENLLASVFKPATVFGVPVRGHVVLTYTGVSVRG